MTVRIIIGEETICVNYLWELEDLRDECEEIKVFEVTGYKNRKSKWKFSLRSEEDNKLLIDLDFSSACRCVILYSFYVCDGEKEKKEKFGVHKGWGSGNLIKRQGSLVRNNFRDRLRIFCEVICKLNVEIGESDIPECQLIDELNFLFDLKSRKEKSPLMELNRGRLFLELEGNNNENMKRESVGDSTCSGEVKILDNSLDYLESSLRECEDSICTQINIDNVLKIFTLAEAAGLGALDVYTVGFIERNIDHILGVTSLEDLEINNPKLAVTLLRVAFGKIDECRRRLDTLKSFLHLE